MDEAAVYRGSHERTGVVSLHLLHCVDVTVGRLISEVELPRGTKDMLMDDVRKLRLDAKEFLSEVRVLGCRQPRGPIFETLVAEGDDGPLRSPACDGGRSRHPSDRQAAA